MRVWGVCGGKAFESEETQKVTGARMLRRERGWADDEVVVMYSGNMGLGHRFGEFLMAAKSLAKERRREFRFAFFGDGKRRDEIKEFTASHPRCRVEVHGYAPAESLGDHLRSADVHLVSLEPSWIGTKIPSKLQGIFAEGRPAIFVGAAESSIARWVIESGGGWVVAAGDVKGMVDALGEAAQSEVLRARGEAAAAYAATHFDSNTNTSRVAEFFLG